MKYEEWLSEWLENYVKISAKHRTIIRYSEIVKQHIVPNLGEHDMDSLTPMMLQKFVSELIAHGNQKTGEGLSASTVNSVITVIQTSLHTAFALSLVKDPIGDKIKRPNMTEKAVECFTLDEQKKIEQAVQSSNKRYMIGVLIALYTGLRIGELIALEWSDIDFDNRLLDVNKTCHYAKNAVGKFSRIIESPKTESSNRVVPLPKQLIPILKELKKQSKSQIVIANNEKDISVRTYQRNFAMVLKSLGIPHRGFHSLRHTFATRALECGMDVKTLSEILGHKNPTITLNRYAHSLLGHKKDMMDRLGKMLL